MLVHSRAMTEVTRFGLVHSATHMLTTGPGKRLIWDEAKIAS
jgi:hypothetical protein